MIDTAMVLAAGLGLRMRPLTLEKPKPLLSVGGRTLIDRSLDRLAAAGVRRAVVNLHYKGEMVRELLQKRTSPDILFSDETGQLLETGGGIVKALHLLGKKPFFVVNSDVIWRDAQQNSLHRLAERWSEAEMDALLLLQPTVGAIGYRGIGDFLMNTEGRLKRRPAGAVSPFVFTGIQLLHPRLFAGCAVDAFSLNLLYDRAAEAGRLFGLRHEGDWMDVGSLDGLAAAEAALSV